MAKLNNLKDLHIGLGYKLCQLLSGYFIIIIIQLILKEPLRVRLGILFHFYDIIVLMTNIVYVIFFMIKKWYKATIIQNFML